MPPQVRGLVAGHRSSRHGRARQARRTCWRAAARANPRRPGRRQLRCRRQLNLPGCRHTPPPTGAGPAAAGAGGLGWASARLAPGPTRLVAAAPARQCHTEAGERQLQGLSCGHQVLRNSIRQGRPWAGVSKERRPVLSHAQGTADHKLTTGWHRADLKRHAKQVLGQGLERQAKMVTSLGVMQPRRARHQRRQQRHALLLRQRLLRIRQEVVSAARGRHAFFFFSLRRRYRADEGGGLPPKPGKPAHRTQDKRRTRTKTPSTDAKAEVWSSGAGSGPDPTKPPHPAMTLPARNTLPPSGPLRRKPAAPSSVWW